MLRRIGAGGHAAGVEWIRLAGGGCDFMTFKGRTGLRVLLGVVVVVLLAWQWWPGRGAKDARAPAPAPASASTSSGHPDAPAATWRRGSLTLHACKIGGAAHGGHGASVEAW